MRLLSLVLGAFVLSSSLGCATYFKRKECEKTNWHEYGHKIAMSGKRLDSDTFIKECTKAEADIGMTDLDRGFKSGMAKYCTSDNVFNVGKAGKVFSYEMCDGENENKMRARYTDGLRVFCTPGNAYRFGAGGGVYENVCNGKDEEAWLAEYRKGRKVYLKAAIDEKERELKGIDVEMSKLELRRSTLQSQQNALARAKNYKKERKFDVRTGTYVERESNVDNVESQQRANDLSHQISSLNWEIDKTRKKQETTSAELSKMRTEMAAL